MVACCKVRWTRHIFGTSGNGGGRKDPDQLSTHLFFKAEGPTWARADLPPGYHWSIWKPALNQLMPNRMNQQHKRFTARWLMHQLHLFSNREYQVLVIRNGRGEIVHYSGATGRYWRWPFMDRGDMQVGDTWTDPDHRGRGLARFALVRLLHELTKPGRRIWYVVHQDNSASIKVARSCGMSLAGTGFITRPRWFAFLHAFVMEQSAAGEESDPGVSSSTAQPARREPLK
jgi:RimJ/RimL family protein N-acetyltransferase